MLGFFKYFNFFADRPRSALRCAWAGSSIRSPLNVILPIGISFYTFMTISYVIDVYRREIQPTPNFIDFALFVALFPAPGRGPDPARVAAAAADCPAAHDHAGADRRAGCGSSPGGCFRRCSSPTTSRRWSTAVFGPSATPTGLDVLVATVRLRVPDLRRLCRLLEHRARHLEADGHRAQRQFPVSVFRHRRRRRSGATGTSACPPGCATISTFRLAATAGRACADQAQPDDHDGPRRPLARRRLDVRAVGRSIRASVLVVARAISGLGGRSAVTDRAAG